MKNSEVVGLNRLPVVGKSSAMMRVRRLASARATTLPRNFSSRIAVRTRAVVAGVTYFVPFTTNDTVAIETPARSATCCIVATATPARSGTARSGTARSGLAQHSSQVPKKALYE